MCHKRTPDTTPHKSATVKLAAPTEVSQEQTSVGKAAADAACVKTPQGGVGGQAPAPSAIERGRLKALRAAVVGVSAKAAHGPKTRGSVAQASPTARPKEAR